MGSVEEPRPVLINLDEAELSWDLIHRMVQVDAHHAIIRMTTAEFVAMGADRVEWGEPDARGLYTPAIIIDGPPKGRIS